MPTRPEANLIKAADMLIARRADTRARADFATWKMLAKLNGTSSLPAEAQSFLAGYKTLLEKMAEPEASEATIHLIYRSYYGEMGGAGAAPDVKAQLTRPRPGRGQRHRLQAAGAEAGQNRRRSTFQAPASRGADFHLPRHRLCRRPLFLALNRRAYRDNTPRREIFTRHAALFSHATMRPAQCAP